jgi:hypothetical protein
MLWPAVMWHSQPCGVLLCGVCVCVWLSACGPVCVCPFVRVRIARVLEATLALPSLAIANTSPLTTELRSPFIHGAPHSRNPLSCPLNQCTGQQETQSCFLNSQLWCGSCSCLRGGAPLASNPLRMLFYLVVDRTPTGLRESAQQRKSEAHGASRERMHTCTVGGAFVALAVHTGLK